MISVLRAALLRKGFLWVGLFAIALEIPGYLDSRHLLGADWTTSVEVVNASVPLLLVLAAVASCLLGASWHGHQELVQTVPGRGSRAILLPACLVTLVMSVVHASYAAAVLWSHRAGTVGTLDLRPLLLIVPAMLAFSLLGLTLARFSSSRLLAPFLGICLYAAVVVTFGTDLEGLVSFGGAGVLLTGTSIDVAHLAWQLTWFLAVATVSGVFLVIAASRPGGTSIGWTGRAMTGAGALLLLTAAAGVGATGGQAREVASDISWTCLGTDPALCALPGHEDEMAEAEPRVREAVGRLRSVEAFPEPTTYRERLAGSDDGSGAGQLSLRMLTTDLEVAFRVIAGTYLCSDDWTQGQLSLADQAAAQLAATPLSQHVTLDRDSRRDLAGLLDRLQC